MYNAENLNDASKEQLRALIQVERQSLARNIEDLDYATSEIVGAGTTALRNPMSTLNDSLSHNLSSKQCWGILGAAFLVGGMVSYMSSHRRSPPVVGRRNNPSLLSAVVEPIASEFIEEAQGLARRFIKDLFRSTERSFAALRESRSELSVKSDSETSYNGVA